jgi:hypothetical protein
MKLAIILECTEEGGALILPIQKSNKMMKGFEEKVIY